MNGDIELEYKPGFVQSLRNKWSAISYQTHTTVAVPPKRTQLKDYDCQSESQCETHSDDSNESESLSTEGVLLTTLEPICYNHTVMPFDDRERRRSSSDMLLYPAREPDNIIIIEHVKRPDADSSPPDENLSQDCKRTNFAERRDSLKSEWSDDQPVPQKVKAVKAIFENVSFPRVISQNAAVQGPVAPPRLKRSSQSLASPPLAHTPTTTCSQEINGANAPQLQAKIPEPALSLSTSIVDELPSDQTTSTKSLKRITSESRSVSLDMPPRTHTYAGKKQAGDTITNGVTKPESDIVVKIAEKNNGVQLEYRKIQSALVIVDSAGRDRKADVATDEAKHNPSVNSGLPQSVSVKESVTLRKLENTSSISPTALKSTLSLKPPVTDAVIVSTASSHEKRVTSAAVQSAEDKSSAHRKGTVVTNFKGMAASGALTAKSVGYPSVYTDDSKLLPSQLVVSSQVDVPASLQDHIQTTLPQFAVESIKSNKEHKVTQQKSDNIQPDPALPVEAKTGPKPASYIIGNTQRHPPSQSNVARTSPSPASDVRSRSSPPPTGEMKGPSPENTQLNLSPGASAVSVKSASAAVSEQTPVSSLKSKFPPSLDKIPPAPSSSPVPKNQVILSPSPVNKQIDVVDTPTSNIPSNGPDTTAIHSKANEVQPTNRVIASSARSSTDKASSTQTRISPQTTGGSSDFQSVLRRRNNDIPVTDIDSLLTSHRGSSSRVFDTRKVMGNKRKVPEYEKIHEGPKIEFTNTDVVAGKSCLRQNQDQMKKSLSFNELDIESVHEYPSEMYMLQVQPKESGAIYFDDPDELQRQGNPIDDAEVEPPSAVFSSDVLRGNINNHNSTKGSLSSHRSSYTGEFNFGQGHTKTDEIVRVQNDEPSVALMLDKPDVKPASDSEVASWSSTTSSDLLF